MTAQDRTSEDASAWACPVCGSESKVVDTYRVKARIARRRECKSKKCWHRWTTYEFLPFTPTCTDSDPS